jgi:hypothetical protein
VPGAAPPRERTAFASVCTRTLAFRSDAAQAGKDGAGRSRLVDLCPEDKQKVAKLIKQVGLQVVDVATGCAHLFGYRRPALHRLQHDQATPDRVTPLPLLQVVSLGKEKQGLEAALAQVGCLQRRRSRPPLPAACAPPGC